MTSNQALSGAYNNSSTVAPGGHCGTGADGVVDPCGRASATLVFGTSTYNYVYYIVNGGNIKFMDIDAATGNGTYYAVARGSMFTAATSFANGNYAFTALGAGKASSSVAAPPLSAGGVFAASNGAITSSVDVNNNGTLESGTPGGTYSIGANGRGSITFTQRASRQQRLRVRRLRDGEQRPPDARDGLEPDQYRYGVAAGAPRPTSGKQELRRNL